MIINFSPVVLDEELVMDREGDVLHINGEEFDFSPLSEGETLPREAIQCKWFNSDVERINGRLVFEVILPCGPNAPESTRFPKPLTVDEDGSVDIPEYGHATVEDLEITADDIAETDKETEVIVDED